MGATEKKLFNPYLGDLDDCINNNMGLVMEIAIKWSKKARVEVDMDDLVQEGLLGLIKAYRNYKPNKNAKFSTYAFMHIKKAIVVFVRDQTESIKPVRTDYEIAGRIMKLKLQTKPPEEISKIVGCSIKAAKRALEHLEKKTPVSLNQTISNSEESETEWVDFLQSHQDLSPIYVDEFMKLIGEFDARIVECLAHDMTQKEIGSLLGTSQMQVSRKLQRIRARAKEYFGRDIA